MKLTKSQQLVIDTMNEKNKNNDWTHWQYLGLSGRTAGTFHALAKKGILERQERVSLFRIKK